MTVCKQRIGKGIKLIPFKREMEILSDPTPEKLLVLLSINREIAAGLMVNNEATTPPPTDPKAAQSPAGATTDISG